MAGTESEVNLELLEDGRVAQPLQYLKSHLVGLSLHVSERLRVQHLRLPSNHLRLGLNLL
jgi:hypothetical protein